MFVKLVEYSVREIGCRHVRTFRSKSSLFFLKVFTGPSLEEEAAIAEAIINDIDFVTQE